MNRRWVRLLLAILSLAAGACVQGSFEFADGTIHCGGTACPPSYVCRADDFCYHSSTGAADGPISMGDGPRAGDAPLGTDGPRLDGPIGDGPASSPDAAPDAKTCSMTDTCNGKCGMVMDACGQTVDCGSTCPNFLQCAQNTPNVCGCPANAFRCFGDTSYQCNADGTQWVMGATCGAGLCNATTNQCAACVPASTRCGGTNDAQTCGSTGQWPPTDGTDVGCVNQTCASGVCSGSCAPGQIQCIDTNGYRSCDANGNFVDQGQACSQIDADFSCTGDRCRCDTGFKRCDFGASSFGTVQTCTSGGVFDDGAVCSSTSRCCECDPGPNVACLTIAACVQCNP
jgi:hypothetical protein